MRKSIVIAAAFALLACLPAFAAPNREPLQVELKVPQVSGGQAAGLQGGVPARSLLLRIEDGRGGAAGTLIGQGTSDEQVLYPILATNDVNAFVDGIARQVVGGWGIDTARGRDGQLVLRYTQFNVNARGRAVGATYVGDVKLAYALTNRAGRTVAEGVVAGNVDHYGKGRSVENCNEALGDALKDALAKLLNEPGFRKVWSDAFTAAPAASAAGERAPPARAAAAGKRGDAATRSIEARLQRLDDLYKKGTITKDEYDRRRAEILSEL